MQKKKIVNELQLMRDIELLKEQVKELKEQVLNQTVSVKSIERMNASGGDTASEPKPVGVSEDKKLKEWKSGEVQREYCDVLKQNVKVYYVDNGIG